MATLRARTDNVRARAHEIKERDLEWVGASDAARAWWTKFESAQAEQPRLILKLCEELQSRRASIGEFFEAFRQSGSTNIQANLHYLDFLRLKDGRAAQR